VKRACAAIFALVLSACASLPSPPVAEAPLSTADTPFTIGGRMSARHGNAGIAGGFSWQHASGHDAIELSTPLGQTLAKLQGDARGATVELQDGRVETAPTWDALTERAFGVTIPVQGLAAWIRGRPRADARFSVERDATGRVSALRQDGWDVVYAYADDNARNPFRVTLSYPGAEPIEVRVVVDRRE
jgi:outer membrane lipoprotein LolB